MFKVVFMILPFLLVLIVMLGFVVPRLKGRVRAQAIWAMVLVACAAKFAVFGAIGGDPFAPELPEKLIWSWNWAYSGMCIFAGLVVAEILVWNAVRGILRLFRAGGRGLRRDSAVLLFVFPAVAWSMSAVGVWNGIKVPDPREVEVKFAGLPAELDGYRILHLTDTHVSSAARRWRTEEIVRKANAAGADLVVVTGDIVDGKPALHWGDVEPLSRLSAKDGVLYCTGNHEFYSDWTGWKFLYDRAGMKFLMNEWTSPRPGLVVAGVTDPVGGGLTGLPDAARAFAGSPEGAFRVLLRHRPKVRADIEPEAGGARADLQLSGHTHGGVMPVLSSLVAAMNGGFVRGLYRKEDGRAVFVSSGTGQWAGFPIRFFDDPEMPVIILRR